MSFSAAPLSSSASISARKADVGRGSIVNNFTVTPPHVNRNGKTPSLLSILLDLSCLTWNNSMDQEALDVEISKHTNSWLFFINAYLASNQHNMLNVIAFDNYSARIIYPTKDTPRSTGDAEFHEHPALSQCVIESVAEGLKTFVSDGVRKFKMLDGHTGASQSSRIASAVSLSLCYINKVSAVEKSKDFSFRIQPRIVVSFFGPDDSKDYVNIMNAVFSAQASNVIIDSVVYEGRHSSFLQQASFLTGGEYVVASDTKKPPQPLLLSLLCSCLPDADARSAIVPGMISRIDLRPTCRCHQKFIDRGYMCSVCLSVFCEKRSVCDVCSSTLMLLDTPMM